MRGTPGRDMHLDPYVFRWISFGGFCRSWKYKPKGNFLFEQSEVEQFMAKFPPVDEFVAHNSPRHIHGQDAFVSVGSTISLEG